MYQQQYSPNGTPDNNQSPYSPAAPYYEAAPQPYPYAVPVYPVMQPPVQSNGKAVASLVLGIVGLIAWLIPLIGLPVAITGLVLASKVRKSLTPSSMANAGYVLCIIALILSVLCFFVGFMAAVH